MIEVIPTIKSFYQTSSDQVGQMLGVILALRFIYVSVTLQGHEGVIQALKGVFSTVVFLYVFDHFFPLYLDQIADYVMTPSKVEFNYEDKAFWEVGTAYIIALIATGLNAVNTILIGILCLSMAVLLPFSFVLSSVLGMDILTDIVKRLFTASVIWLVINYIMHGYANSNDIDLDSPISYYFDLCLSSLFSLGGALASTMIQQIAQKALDTVQSKYNEMRYEGKKAKIKDGLEKGKLDTNAQGEAVKKGLALNPNLAAVKEYQAEKGPKEQKIKEALKSKNLHEILVGKPKEKKGVVSKSLEKVSKVSSGIKSAASRKSITSPSGASSIKPSSSTHKSVHTTKTASFDSDKVKRPNAQKTPAKVNTQAKSYAKSVKPIKDISTGLKIINEKRTSPQTLNLPVKNEIMKKEKADYSKQIKNNEEKNQNLKERIPDVKID